MMVSSATSSGANGGYQHSSQDTWVGNQTQGQLLMDALAQSWREIKRFAFPPFSLTGRWLSKIWSEKVSELILVAPVWHGLLSCYWCYFKDRSFFQKYPFLLRNPLNDPHPLIHQLNLAVWPAPGIPSRVKEFQEQCQVSSSWRKATEAANSCNWRRWEWLCTSSGYNPFKVLSWIFG